MALTPLRTDQAWPLHDEMACGRAESDALAQTPAHTLMDRAGTSLARLAMALAPHADQFWVACGPGNNGGDGLIAALRLHQWGRQVWVSRVGAEPAPGGDAEWALDLCRQAEIPMHEEPPGVPWGLAIDALYGLGARPGLPDIHADWLHRMRRSRSPLLCADVPSGLNASTGLWSADPDLLSRGGAATHTLSLLTLKTGLFTGAGRDAAGRVWWDDLGCGMTLPPPTAQLLAAPPSSTPRHDTHKGQRGTVWVVGGDQGMAGAAWLAAQSALRRGAGRVHVQLLVPETTPLPRPLALMAATALPNPLGEITVVAGCGGGQAIRAALPLPLSQAHRLVLDADALNALASDPGLQTGLRGRRSRGKATVITPHPLEAARLLGLSVREVQADRIGVARRLAEATQSAVVLKGSGTVIADPDGRLALCPTGNARLATAGSGDVLAGWIGARLAQGDEAWNAACHAVYAHGLQAESGPPDLPLIADDQ